MTAPSTSPWASVFESAAIARALSAIQAEGFRAASRIVDGFVRAVEPDNNGTARVESPLGAAVNGNGTGSVPMPDIRAVDPGVVVDGRPVPAPVDAGARRRE